MAVTAGTTIGESEYTTLRSKMLTDITLVPTRLQVSRFRINRTQFMRTTSNAKIAKTMAAPLCWCLRC